MQVDAASAIRTMHACMCICVRMALYFTRDTNSTRKDSYRIPFRTCCPSRIFFPTLLLLTGILAALLSCFPPALLEVQGSSVAQKTGMMPLRRASVVKTSGFLPEPAAQISISSASSRPRRSKACQFFKAFLLIHFVMYAAGGGYQGGLSCLYDIRHAFTKSYLL